MFAHDISSAIYARNRTLQRRHELACVGDPFAYVHEHALGMCVVKYREKRKRTGGERHEAANCLLETIG